MTNLSLTLSFCKHFHFFNVSFPESILNQVWNRLYQFQFWFRRPHLYEYSKQTITNVYRKVWKVKVNVFFFDFFFRFNNNIFLLSQLISLVKKDSQEKDFNIVNLYTCRISTNRPTLTAFFLELLIKQVGKQPMPYNRNRIAFLHCLSRKLKH